MDLSELEIPDTVTVHLEFPTIGKLYDDEGTVYADGDERINPVTISLHSPASKQAIAYKHKVQKDVISRMGKKGKKGIELSDDEIDQREAERLVAFTASVNNLKYKGKVMTPETVMRVYRDPKMGWLCDQLKERLLSWDDFLA